MRCQVRSRLCPRGHHPDGQGGIRIVRRGAELSDGPELTSLLTDVLARLDREPTSLRREENR